MSAVLAQDPIVANNLVSLCDYRANFEQLAATCANSKVVPSELRRHIDGLKLLETTFDFYGDYADAARMILDARITELEARYAEMRPIWEAHLAELKTATALSEDEIKAENGPGLLESLKALEEGKASGFREEAFGDLTDEALAVQDDAIARFERALARVAVMVVDPETIKDSWDKNIPVHLLEYALKNFKALPLTLDAFRGHTDLLEEAKRLHPLSVKKLEERVAAAKERTVEQVKGAIENREEMEHRHRVEDAGLTPEQRAARTQRMIEASEHLFNAVRRLTEIVTLDEENHVGMLDADNLLPLAQQAQALVLRVEGKLN